MSTKMCTMARQRKVISTLLHDSPSPNDKIVSQQGTNMSRPAGQFSCWPEASGSTLSAPSSCSLSWKVDDDHSMPFKASNSASSSISLAGQRQGQRYAYGLVGSGWSLHNVALESSGSPRHTRLVPSEIRLVSNQCSHREYFLHTSGEVLLFK